MLKHLEVFFYSLSRYFLTPWTKHSYRHRIYGQKDRIPAVKELLSVGVCREREVCVCGRGRGRQETCKQMNQPINMMISGRSKCCGLVEPIDDIAVPSLSSELEREIWVRQWRPKHQLYGSSKLGWRIWLRSATRVGFVVLYLGIRKTCTSSPRKW